MIYRRLQKLSLRVFVHISLLAVCGTSHSQQPAAHQSLIGNWVSLDAGKQSCWTHSGVADVPGSPDLTVRYQSGKLNTKELEYSGEFRIVATNRNAFQQIVWTVEGTGFELGGEEKIVAIWTLIANSSGAHTLSISETVTHVRDTLKANSQWLVPKAIAPRIKLFSRC